MKFSGRIAELNKLQQIKQKVDRNFSEGRGQRAEGRGHRRSYEEADRSSYEDRGQQKAERKRLRMQRISNKASEGKDCCMGVTSLESDRSKKF